MADIKRPTFAQVQREVTAYALALAVLVDECVERGAGKRMLGLGEDESLRDVIDRFDPTRIRMARHLSVYYEYAYDARVPAGHAENVDPYTNLAEHLRDFSGMFGPDANYFDLCLDVVGLDPNTETGFLADMISRWEARHSLDDGSELSITQLALLADMNERSVRNAASLDGEARLTLKPDQMVSNGEARRWLAGRRGFRPTDVRELRDDSDMTDEQLSPAEIPAFVARRLLVLSGGTGLDEWLQKGILDGSFESAIPEYVEKEANSVGLTPRALARAMHLPLQIAPGDCEAIARAIRVDPVWFTLQVMQALYPKPMDMILNPTAYRREEGPSLSAPISEIEIELSDAMIQHGYLDFPSTAKALFPEDCFAARAGDDRGTAIELRYDEHTVQTDIRQKSDRLISPRKRFSGWLKTQTTARPGDHVKLRKVAERSFELSFIPMTRSN